MAYDETQKDFPLLGSQVRILDLVEGGGGPASEAESCWHSRAELCEKGAFCGWGLGSA